MRIFLIQFAILAAVGGFYTFAQANSQAFCDNVAPGTKWDGRSCKQGIKSSSKSFGSQAKSGFYSEPDYRSSTANLETTTSPNPDRQALCDNIAPGTRWDGYSCNRFIHSTNKTYGALTRYGTYSNYYKQRFGSTDSISGRGSRSGNSHTPHSLGRVGTEINAGYDDDEISQSPAVINVTPDGNTGFGSDGSIYNRAGNGYWGTDGTRYNDAAGGVINSKTGEFIPTN